MGLDYGYEIVCTQAQLWDVLDDAAELSLRDFRTRKVNAELEDREVELDYSAIVGTRPAVDGEPVKALDLSTSSWFAVDEALQEYYMDTGDWQRYKDEQGRIPIGCICIDIYFDNLFDTLPNLIEPGDVRINFTAATTQMSLLFEKSTSIRQTFVQLAQKHQHTICLLDREGNDDILLWIDGESVLEEVGDSLMLRDELRERLRANRIARQSQQHTPG